MATTYAQTGRLLQLTTPLGTDVLKMEKVQRTEALSALYPFELALLADAATTVTFDQILGQAVTVQIQAPDGSTRYLNGIVSRFAEGGQVQGSQGKVTFTRFRAEV